MTTKKCAKCQTVFPVEGFWKNRSKPDGLYAECKTCCGTYFRKAHKKNRSARKQRDPRLHWAKSALGRVKKRAREKDIPFDLELDDILRIMPDKCPVLGCDLEYSAVEFTEYNSASIDRIVGDFGYVKSNIAILSQEANRMKNSASLDEIEKVALWTLVQEVVICQA